MLAALLLFRRLGLSVAIDCKSRAERSGCGKAVQYVQEVEENRERSTGEPNALNRSTVHSGSLLELNIDDEAGSQHVPGGVTVS